MTSYLESKCQIVKGLVLALSAISTISVCSKASALIDTSKITLEDFPTRGRELPAQTPVSFVVNTSCAEAQLRYLKPGGMLNGVLAQAAKFAGKIEQHSVGVELNSSVSFNDIETELKSNDCVEMAGYDGEVSIASAERASGGDPERPRQPYLNYLHFDQAIALLQPYLMIRKDVVIAIIDAGTDLSHNDLSSGAWRNLREIPGNGRDDDHNGYVDDVVGYNFPSGIGNPAPQVEGIVGEHGTHVAGLAAARWKNGIGIAGVDGVAKIMALNVFGTNRTTKSSIVENAIRYAARNGASVINLSLSGGEYSRTMASALRYAVDRGSFIVSAAGNAGLKIQTSPTIGTFFSPAAYGGAISGMVTVTSTDAESGSLSRFSNFNPEIVQLAAPGAIRSVIGEPIGLYSTFPSNRYSTLAGTSMAAPLVSGAAALVIQYLKACGMDANPSRVESILLVGSPLNPKLLGYVSSGRELNLLSLANYLLTIKGGHCR